MTDARNDMLRAPRDAYAMEGRCERLLRNHATRSLGSPEVNARIEAHLTETLANQNSLARCLERIDESNSILQTRSDDYGAEIQTSNVVQTRDEVVKSLVSLYVFKHQEIASYTSLIAIAEASGFFETKLACETIVLQQTAMADWLFDRLPADTKAYLSHRACPSET